MDKHDKEADLQSCSYCGCIGRDDEIFATGDPDDPYICIDCIEKAEECRILDLVDAFCERRLRQAEKLALFELWLQENGPALPHPAKVDRFED